MEDKREFVKPKVLAVDGDIIAYRTAAVCEEHFEGSCDDILDGTLKDIATDTDVPNVRIYISDKRNFRHDIAKTLPYKGNRDSIKRPQFLDYCKAYLVKNYGAIVVPGYEADDAIATDMRVNGAAHCGIDKDLFQCAGLHYNYTKKEWVMVDRDEAELNLYRQVLMGDKADNVPGLPGIGEGKAAKAIYVAETAMVDAMEFYTMHCAKTPSLAGVEPLVYFNEQLALIRMDDDVKLHAIDFDEYFTLKQDAAGFEPQEGTDVQSDVRMKVRGL